MARPNLTIVRDMPVYGLPSPTRLGQLEFRLRSLEQGQFSGAAELVEAMMRDDRVAGVMMTRIHGLLGLPLEFTAAKDTARGRSIADDCEEAWFNIFPDDRIAELLFWGIMVGVGIGQLIWERRADEWRPRLHVHHPRNVYWHWDTRSYFLTAYDGQAIELIPGNGQWIIYAPYGHEYAWMRGLVRPLASPWLSRQWARKDWSNYSEAHGQPTRLAIVPQTALAKEKREFVSKVAAAESNTTVKLERSADDKGYDVKLLEAVANNHEGFEKLIRHNDIAIAVTILGQNMSTDGLGGLGAQEKAGEPVRIDIKRKDSLIADVLREQGLKWWVTYNRGDPDLTPWVCWQVDPPEDGKAVADELKVLAEAISLFKAAGAPIDVRELLERHNVPMLEESEVENAAGVHPDFLATNPPPIPDMPMPDASAVPPDAANVAPPNG